MAEIVTHLAGPHGGRKILAVGITGQPPLPPSNDRPRLVESRIILPTFAVISASSAFHRRKNSGLSVLRHVGQNTIGLTSSSPTGQSGRVKRGK
jgi:hypothetical protein